MSQEEQKVIKIGEKFYDPASFTELSVALLKDIQRIEEEISNINLQTNIYKLAKAKLIDELGKELPKLTEVEAPQIKE